MTAQSFEESYVRMFGEEDYKKLKEFRIWIFQSKLKGEILAYLIDEDPYRI